MTYLQHKLDQACVSFVPRRFHLSIVMNLGTLDSGNDRRMPNASRVRTRGRFRIVEDHETLPNHAETIPRDGPGAKRSPKRGHEENQGIYKQKERQPGATMPHGAWPLSPGRQNELLGKPKVPTTAGKSMSPAILRILMEEARLDQDAYAERRISSASQTQHQQGPPYNVLGKPQHSHIDGNLAHQVSCQIRSRSTITESDQRSCEVDPLQPVVSQTEGPNAVTSKARLERK